VVAADITPVTWNEILAFATKAVAEGFPLVESPWLRTDPDKSKAGGLGWDKEAHPWSGTADALARYMCGAQERGHNMLIVPGTRNETARRDLIGFDVDDGEGDKELADKLGLSPTSGTYTVQRAHAPDRFHAYFRAVGFIPEKPVIKIERKVKLCSRNILVAPCSWHPGSSSFYMPVDPNAPLLPITEEEYQLFVDEYTRYHAARKSSPRKATPDLISEGNRHDAIRDFVWAHFQNGEDREHVRKLAHVYNVDRCEPPRSTEHVDELVDYTFNANPAPGVTADPSQVVIRIRDASAILTEELEKPEPIIEGIVYPGSIAVVGGYSGAGKSPMTVGGCRAMLNGTEFVGIPVHEVPADFTIVYLTQESEYSFKPLLERSGLTPEEAAGRFKVVYLATALKAFKGKWNWPGMVTLAVEQAGTSGLIVMDTLAAWARVKDQTSDSEMTEAFGPLVEATGSGLSAWVNAQAWKSANGIVDSDIDSMHIAGAGAIEADASVIAMYKKTKPRTQDNVRYFKVVRNRFEEQANYIEPRYVEQVEGGALQRASGFDVIFHAEKNARDRVVEAVTAAGADGLVYAKIEEETGISVSGGELARAVEAAEMEGRIHATGKKRGHGANAYTLHVGPAPDGAAPAEASTPGTTKGKHADRLAMQAETRALTKTCGCGCGEELPKGKRRYVEGHSPSARKKSTTKEENT
jgi:hypothetical protein